MYRGPSPKDRSSPLMSASKVPASVSDHARLRFHLQLIGARVSRHKRQNCWYIVVTACPSDHTILQWHCVIINYDYIFAVVMCKV